MSVVNSSGDMPKRTGADVVRQIQQLSRLIIADLKIKYRQVFGEKTKVLHKQFLIRRIAWKIQANDVSIRAARSWSKCSKKVLNGSLSATAR